MKILLDEIRKIETILKNLDNEVISDREKVNEAIDTIRRYYDRRLSFLILRAEIIKEKLRKKFKNPKKKIAEVDTLVIGALTKIKDSGYLDSNSKFPLKRKRGRPKALPARAKNHLANANPNITRYRFSVTPDLSCIFDEVHKKPEYDISMYEGITASIAVKVINLLLDAACKKKNEGWVHSHKSWRGAFQYNVYHRFRAEQIQHGTRSNGHLGDWRIITNGEFDTLSTAGRYYHRKL